MQYELYKEKFNTFFDSALIKGQIKEAVKMVKASSRIFFLGNGGSNSICSHMMEDFGKMARIPSFAFSDPPLVTCYANDYGWEKAMEEYLKLYYTDKNDLLVGISSSGESKNIINAVNLANQRNGNTITLSGFKAGNSLSKLGKLNFHTEVSNFGMAECFHQVILHSILDDIMPHRDLK